MFPERARLIWHRGESAPRNTWRRFRAAFDGAGDTGVLNPGSNYFATTAFTALSERPGSASPSGYFLDVGALTPHGTGGCQQTLTRYGTGMLPEIFVRIVSESGATSPWANVGVTAA